MSVEHVGRAGSGGDAAMGGAAGGWELGGAGGEGGSGSTGGSAGAEPCSGLGSWSATSTAGAPSERLRFVAAWTGSEMIVWGGIYFEDPSFFLLGDGARYDPQVDAWSVMSEAGPGPRDAATGVLTGAELIVWGGLTEDNSGSGTGAVYHIDEDGWTPVTMQGAPAARAAHTAVWTGSEMIVWGGSMGLGALGDGARYDPIADTWSPISAVGAPAARSGHEAVWTGTEMIVWGGLAGENEPLDTGSLYDPASDSWRPMSSAGAPSPRHGHSAVWTGSRLIVWGGEGGESGPYLGDGASYDPANDSWSPVSDAGAPKSRMYHTAVWTGSRMIVWGGDPPHGDPNAPASGGLYDPATDSWEPTSTCGAPHWSWQQDGVWTGSQLIVWGGRWGSLVPGGPGLGGVYTPP